MDLFRLEVFQVNEFGRCISEMFVLDTMVDVTRTLLTYQCKRGYRFQGCELTVI